MKIVIDSKVCEKEGISVQDACFLYAISGRSLNSVVESMKDRGVIKVNLVGEYLLSSEWSKTVTTILHKSDKTMPSVDEVEKLATALRELFPEGKKPGTSKSWRGNKRDISLKLQKFFKLYGNEYTNEQIISATKSYVESYNGNYSYMRVLEYFIHKNVNKVDSDGRNYIEEVSELANFLEDDSVSITTHSDWTAELV